MTNISLHPVRCSCGHTFSARLYESVNTQLSAEAVETFLRGDLNCPVCPNCHEQMRISIPVLFNDMERSFMVWVGSGGEPDEDIEEREDIIYAEDYFAALEALAVFRADPANAAIPFRQMTREKTQSYVQSFLKLYNEFLSAEELT